MSKKNIAPRITDDCRSYLTDNFRNANAGAEYTLESANVLYRQTLRGLKGRFSDGELKLMIDVMNATMLTPVIAGGQLQGNVIGGIALDGLAEKWEIDGEVMIKKLTGCHIFEQHCLEIWANGFWYGGDPDKKLDIEARVKMLL